MYIAKDKVYANSELATEKKARFDAYTWTYFFLFPYKLSDRGTSWAAYDTTGMDKEFDVQKLTFAPNTGDAPDDWYITYASKKSHLIDHAAYIVTLGKTQAEAEENPHAIQYLDYRSVDGVPIAHRWVFWEWNKTDGLTKEIGEATLTNIHFVDGFTKDFKVPADLMEVE